MTTRMRLLFSSVPAYGHAYPIVPLALAARDAGHEVLFATGDPFRNGLQQFGLETIPAGMTVTQAVATANGGSFDLHTMTPERRAWLGAEAFGAILPRAFFDALVPAIDRFRPDLVVYEATNVGAYVAARHTGTPGVCHGLGRVLDSDKGAAITRRIAAFANEVGVPYPCGFNHGSADPYLDICPPSIQDSAFAATAGRIPLRPAPVPQPDRLPAWIRDRDRPLVYVTLGTVFSTTAVLQSVIAGLARLDCDVLVTTGRNTDPGTLGPLPDNVTAVPWVAEGALLAHVRLVVHHGGPATTLGSLAAGLPQLALPQSHDQLDHAAAMAGAGAGRQLLAADLSADAVRAAADLLLTDPRYAARAGEVAAEIAAMPSPAATVPALVALADHDAR